MRYTCPKCGKHIELSTEALIAAEYKTVCPQCLTSLEIVGDYAYVPLADGSLRLQAEPDAPAQEEPVAESTPVAVQPEVVAEQSPSPSAPPPLPASVSSGHVDPLLSAAVEYLAQCNAITPMMLRDYFGIELERAQLIMSQLEQAGVVGPNMGGAPRQILIPHRQDLPSPLSGQLRYDPHAEQMPADDEEPAIKGRQMSVSCGGCLLWIVVIAFVITMMRSCM
ncbi:MAG: hypothetical protein IJ808_00395 [Muribaculaceae bacterium]|nr:hypothetical protein [Muribaculaceae bacterium]